LVQGESANGIHTTPYMLGAGGYLPGEFSAVDADYKQYLNRYFKCPSDSNTRSEYDQSYLIFFINAAACPNHGGDAYNGTDSARCIVGRDNPANAIVMDTVIYYQSTYGKANHPTSACAVKLGGDVENVNYPKSFAAEASGLATIIGKYFDHVQK
jgi:hypothetical protein